jgi:N-methylhydantoinase B
MSATSVAVNCLLEDIPAAREAGFWDGVRRGYIPPEQLAIDGSLKLHRTLADSVDPVTYEVIRYSLLNINLEHNALLQKLAVSIGVVLARDYQTTVLTEDGAVLFVGPGVQYFANTAGLCVQYTLENRSANPGIGPGDMFFSNDAFVGAPHQMDATLAAPIFIGEQLFCWVANTIHYHDVGGTVPGSFCHQATDAWQEAAHWPPIKLVESGRLRNDIERLFVRQSRFPVEVGMDLRAAIAANEYSRQKVVRLVERYGADVVKKVMHGTMDAGQRLFKQRLQSIPDGRWSHRFYTEGAVPGDQGIYSMQVNLTKVGDRLIVDNRGTDPQAGSINMTFGPFAGSVLAGIMGQMVPDLAGAYGGAYRCVEFRPEPGRVLCADYPAAISPTPFTGIGLINATAIATAKMLSCGSEEAHNLILGAQFSHPSGCFAVAGTDKQGNLWHTIGTETTMGSFGGSPTKDGADFAGHWWIPGGIGPNIEDLEARNPAVYLYRRALPVGVDGAGRHRGGLGFVFSLYLRGICAGVVMNAFGEAFPKGGGVFGSSPGSRSRVTVVHHNDIAEQLAGGHVPASTSEVEGERVELPWKTNNHPVADGDLVEGVFPSIPGFGDPLRREPADVLRDVEAKMLDFATAARAYGVLITDDGVDRAGTTERRRVARRERLGGKEPGELLSPPAGARRVGELLYVVNRRWWCNGADLGPVEDSYKRRAIVRESPIRMLGPEFETPFAQVADRIALREFICPVTGYRIDAETVLFGQESLDDIRLQL